MNENEKHHLHTDVHDALCFVLWHHQGGSSKIGQPIRAMLGLGQHDHMTGDQYFAAKRVAEKLAVDRAHAWPELLKAAVDSEREACAKVCDAVLTDVVINAPEEYKCGRDMGATVCAAAIRARGDK